MSVQENPNPEFLARRLVAIDAEIVELREQRAEVEDAMVAIMPHRLEVEGIGAFERYRTKDRRQWNNDDLARTVFTQSRAARRTNPDTGEIETEGEAVLRELMECSRPTWRITALKQRGIDADEYAEVLPGRTTVRFYGKTPEGGDAA